MQTLAAHRLPAADSVCSNSCGWNWSYFVLFGCCFLVLLARKRCGCCKGCIIALRTWGAVLCCSWLLGPLTLHKPKLCVDLGTVGFWC